jgi:hypothetical protein
MVTVRKSYATHIQGGRKCESKVPLFKVDISEPPHHFDDLHRRMWDHIVNYPNFKPTSAAYRELAAALDAHIVFVRLTDEIAALRKKGKQPETRLLLAAAASRRPLARVIRQLVIY